jgi:hypothetical protein
MTPRNLLLIAVLAGIALAVAGVIAAMVGFSMDETYPEEVPGWSIGMVWGGVAVAAVAGFARLFTTK